LDGKLLEDAHILTHPIRNRILEQLAEQPMHISELSRALPEERRLITYHLAALEERGLLN
jgi:DNA-binding transcriptional ArsR family regulator